jgi:hypothetical protein
MLLTTLGAKLISQSICCNYDFNGSFVETKRLSGVVEHHYLKGNISSCENGIDEWSRQRPMPERRWRQISGLTGVG